MKKTALSKIQGTVQAVDDVSFQIKKGETLGLVGESGSGKSTIGRAILRLLEPTSGEVYFKEVNLLTLSSDALSYKRREMQIIFQDPFASLNPRFTVGRILEEPFHIHKIGDPKEKLERVKSLLEKVGLSADHSKRYPHEFSGGQRQRIGIARAIALGPEFIVADEPVSALDVSIQAQILNLLQDLKKDMNISFLFISHDMAVIEHLCDRVAVLYLGKIVELAERSQLYQNPLHPYTEALLSAIPKITPGSNSKRIIIQGDIPNAMAPPSGCAFQTRCPLKEKRCEESPPELQEAEPGHFVSCHIRP